MITFCLFSHFQFLFLIYFHEFVVCLFFKGRVLAARITYLFIYNSCGFPAHALLLQLLIPWFSVWVSLCFCPVSIPGPVVFLSDVCRRCGVAASPQLSVYIVLGAVLSLPRADLSLQMSLGFLHECLVWGWGGGSWPGPSALSSLYL